MKIKMTPHVACDGFSNNDIEQFTQNSLPSLVREQAQNSLDAAASENSRPVELDFSISRQRTSSLPDLPQFRDIIAACNAMSREGTDVREQEFFEQANSILEEDYVSILTVSDYHTKGVGGDFRPGGGFYTLVKTTGTSSGKPDHAGGSFGIGKMCSFACSKLRTVFYSAVSESGEFNCMGRACLRSWRLAESLYSYREIWWGEGDDNQPVTIKDRVPDWMRRDEVGLSTHIVSVQDSFSQGWEDKLLKTLISNFYVAILNDYIRFSINGGEKVLRKENLLSEISRFEENADADFKLAAAFARMMASDVQGRNFSVEGAGDFVLNVQTEGVENFKRVQIVRNGMVITDTLKNFSGDQLKMFRGLKPFVAVLTPAARKSSSSNWLKRLEGPAHDELTTEFLKDREQKKLAEDQMNAIAKEVRKIVNELASSAAGMSHQLSEIDKFLKSKSEDLGSSDNKENKDSAKLIFKRRKGAQDKSQKGFKKGGDKGVRGAEPGRGQKDKRTTKRGRVAGGGGKGGPFQSFDIKARVIRADGGKPFLRRILLSDIPFSGEVNISIVKTPRTGTEEKIAAKIVSGLAATEIDGSLRFSVTEGESISFEVEIEEDINVLYAATTITKPKVSILDVLRR